MAAVIDRPGPRYESGSNPSRLHFLYRLGLAVGGGERPRAGVKASESIRQFCRNRTAGSRLPRPDSREYAPVTIRPHSSHDLFPPKSAWPNNEGAATQAKADCIELQRRSRCLRSGCSRFSLLECGCHRKGSEHGNVECSPKLSTVKGDCAAGRDLRSRGCVGWGHDR